MQKWGKHKTLRFVLSSRGSLLQIFLRFASEFIYSFLSFGRWPCSIPFYQQFILSILIGLNKNEANRIA